MVAVLGRVRDAVAEEGRLAAEALARLPAEVALVAVTRLGAAAAHLFAWNKP